MAVALASNVIGILIAVAPARQKVPVLSGLVSQLSFSADAAARHRLRGRLYRLYGAPIGPLPAHTAQKLLLGLALTAATLPFAIADRTGDDLADIRAISTGGAPGQRRLPLPELGAITLPLAARGLTAGLLIAFVNVIGDLTITILLSTRRRRRFWQSCPIPMHPTGSTSSPMRSRSSS